MRSASSTLPTSSIASTKKRSPCCVGCRPALAAVTVEQVARRVALERGRQFPAEVAGILAGLHREIAMRSRCFDSRTVADSGHLVMKDRPDAIIAAVQELIAASGTKVCPFSSAM